VTLAHWDEVEQRRPERRGLGGTWRNLGGAAGSVRVGAQRIDLAAGEVSTPAHVHGADEEIFFVLEGSGLSWQDGRTYEIHAGDCLVHRAQGAAHTLRAGGDGLSVLAFGQRTPIGGAYLPRVGVRWLNPSWAEAGTGENPFDREQHLDWPDASERPASIVSCDEVEGDYGGRWKRLGKAAGALQTGLNRADVPPNDEGAPPHCHSADEEIFVVLAGEGTLELWGPPVPGEPPAAKPAETHAIRTGHVISRPAGTGRSHCLRTGDSALTYLAYGTREPDDVCYYPRSNKIYWRGLGLIARLEPLGWSDGEPG